MRIAYGKLLLRNAEANDAAQLAAWWNDGAVMAHAGFPRGLGTTPEKIADQLTADSDGKRRRLMLLLEGRPIGEMSFSWLDGEKAEIGIKICESAYRERGLGRLALSLLIGELFIRGVSTILLDTNTNNLRAQHVYHKLGFRVTGVRQDCWRDQLGRFQSAVDMALTQDRFVDFTKIEGAP